jgi:hypothetical protein
MDTDNRVGEMMSLVPAVVTKTQGQLFLSLGAEAAMAVETSSEFWEFDLFADVNFGMDFETDHLCSPKLERATRMPVFGALSY